MNLWGLVDDRTGHTGQVLGVIAKLGVPYVLKRLEYNAFTFLPNSLLGASLLAVDKPHSAPLTPPWPSLVIAAGRRTLPVMRYIKKKSPATVTVYLMWPGTTRDIDLLAVPAHDRIEPGKKVINTLAPLHAVTPETLVAARDAWAPQFSHLPRPWVALTLGGNTKQGHYSAADWRELIRQAQALAGSGSLLITTSRRTPPEAISLFAPLLSTPHLLHRWDTDKDNPYLGLLGAADAIIVTGDSLSMCAEACVSGKPVYVFSNPSVVPAKHRALHEQLYSRGMARPLDANASMSWKPTAPLDDAGQVAAEIRKRFPQLFAQ
jgi:hypothetical protein